jgi:hypothetical protein
MRPRLRIAVVPAGVRLDGHLDDAAWAAARPGVGVAGALEEGGVVVDAAAEKALRPLAGAARGVAHVAALLRALAASACRLVDELLRQLAQLERVHLLAILLDGEGLEDALTRGLGIEEAAAHRWLRGVSPAQDRMDGSLALSAPRRP